jgi:hypothetical protein
MAKIVDRTFGVFNFGPRFDRHSGSLRKNRLISLERAAAANAYATMVDRHQRMLSRTYRAPPRPRLLERLTGVLHVDVVAAPFRVQDLLGVEHDVGHLPLEHAGGLVDHDASVWHGEPQALGSSREQERGHGGGLSDAQSRYRRAHELHRVVDRKSRGHHATRRDDIHADLFLWVVGLKKEQLRYHEARDRVVDRAGDEDDAFR